MGANKSITVPNTNIKLYDGDIVKVSNYPGVKWVVHYGWFIYQNAQNYDWYFSSIKDGTVLPVSAIDLTTVSLATTRTIGSNTNDGKVVNYTTVFTLEDESALHRAFITVDTLDQLHNLNHKNLVDGKMVRVNNAGGVPRYYIWHKDTSEWSILEDISGIPEREGTPLSPVILSNLPIGIYRVCGTYLICPTTDITITTDVDHLVFVSGMNLIRIKVITEYDMTDYKVESDRVTSSARYVTNDYVDSAVNIIEQQISEIISEICCSSISYNPPVSGTTSGSHNVQDAIDALNTAISSGDKEVFYGTTAYWNNQPQLVPIQGCLYVYSDYATDAQGNNVAGIKVGDGTSYLIDMPFIDALYNEHIANTAIHVSSDDRSSWEDKVTCDIDPYTLNTLIFTKN